MLPNLARLALQQADTGPVFTNYGPTRLEEAARAAGVVFRPSQKPDAACAICINEFVAVTDAIDPDVHELVVLKNCGDTFHASCLKQWMTSGKPNASKCPNCRATIHPEDRAALDLPEQPELSPEQMEEVEEMARSAVYLLLHGDPVHQLIIGTMTGNVDLVRAALAAGAPIDETPRDTNMTALMMAAAAGHPSVVRVLLDAGAEVDKPGRRGSTALHTVIAKMARAGDRDALRDVARMLLAAGADPNKAADDGTTPLEIATDWGEETIVRMLREASEGRRAARATE
jgi:hypothetical protein